MDSTWLEFEGASLAGLMWAVVAAGLSLELLRYILIARRPASRAARILLSAACAIAIASGWHRGALRWLTASCLAAGFLLGILLILWTLRSYRRTTRPISPALARMLIGLRIAAAGIVLLILLQPVLAWVDVVRERAVVGVLLDDSRSMTVRDVPRSDGAAVSRLDAIRKALRENAAALGKLEDGAELRWFRFAADVQEARSPLLEGDGACTAIWDAVSRTQVLLAQSGRKIAGLLVISDGRDNYSGPDTAGIAEGLGSAGVPLYAVGVGSEVPTGQTRRLQARRLDCPTRVPLFNRLSTQLELLAGGLAGATIDVVLLDGTQVVDRRQVKPASANEILRVELACTPLEPGLHRMTARATTADLPEAALTQFVQVVQDRIRVLYLDRARYERASIARALEASKDLEVTKADASTGGKMPANTPYDAYDVVILGDVNRAALGSQFSQNVASLVLQKGHGLALLGGPRSFAAGGWESRALDAVLPVEIQEIGELPAPVACLPTPAGATHPICQLATEPQAGDALWKALPPMSGATRLGTAKPAAEILLRTSYGEPLLAVQEAGKGRSAVVGIDATWQWGLAHDKGLEVQRRFWRQLVLWLANRRPQVWVNPERPRYAMSRLRSGEEQVVLRAGVAQGQPAVPMNVTLNGKLIMTAAAPEPAAAPGATASRPAPRLNPGQSTDIAWKRQGQEFEAGIRVARPGEYRVKVSAASTEAGKSNAIGEAETAFVVEASDLELSDPLADVESLRRLAAATSAAGGGYYPLDQLGQVLEKIRAAGHVTEITRYHRRQLVNDHPWFWFAAFLCLLATEWIVRRASGLV